MPSSTSLRACRGNVGSTSTPRPNCGFDAAAGDGVGVRNFLALVRQRGSADRRRRSPPRDAGRRPGSYWLKKYAGWRSRREPDAEGGAVGARHRQQSLGEPVGSHHLSHQRAIAKGSARRRRFRNVGGLDARHEQPPGSGRHGVEQEPPRWRHRATEVLGRLPERVAPPGTSLPPKHRSSTAPAEMSRRWGGCEMALQNTQTRLRPLFHPSNKIAHGSRQKRMLRESRVVLGCGLCRFPYVGSKQPISSP
jgi:hypothetical protein